MKGIRVTSKDELKDRIYKYFNEINEDPVVYHWQWELEDVDVNGELNVTTLLSDDVWLISERCTSFQLEVDWYAKAWQAAVTLRWVRSP